LNKLTIIFIRSTILS